MVSGDAMPTVLTDGVLRRLMVTFAGGGLPTAKATGGRDRGSESVVGGRSTLSGGVPLLDQATATDGVVQRTIEPGRSTTQSAARMVEYQSS